MRLEALLVVVMVCVFVEKPWGNFDRNSFGLVFKAVLSGAKLTCTTRPRKLPVVVEVLQEVSPLRR